MKFYLLHVLIWAGVFIFYCGEASAVNSPPTQEKPVVIVTDEEFPHWRYWNGDDDCSFIWVSRVDTDLNGNVYTVKENSSFMFDGYDFVPLPYTRKTNPLQAGVNNQFWQRTRDAIEIFDMEGSQTYPLLDRIDGFEKRETTPPDTTLSLQTGQLYILTQDTLHLFHTENDTVEPILQSSQTNIGQFVSIHTDHKESVWIAGMRGVLEFTIDDHQVQPGQTYQEFIYPIETPNRVHFVNAYSDRELTVNLEFNSTYFYQLKDDRWTLLHHGRRTKGWLGHDGGFWIEKRLEDTSRRIQYHAKNLIYEMRPNKYSSSMMRIFVHDKHSFWFTSHNGLVSFHAPVWRHDYSALHETPKLINGKIDSSTQSSFFNNKQLLVKDDNQWKELRIPRWEVPKNLPKMIMDHPHDVYSKLLIYGYELFQYDPKALSPISLYRSLDDYIHSYFVHPDGTVYLALNENKLKIVSFRDGSIDPLFEFHSQTNSVNYNDFIVRNTDEVFFIYDKQLYLANDEIVNVVHSNDGKQIGALQHIFLMKDNSVLVAGEQGIFEWSEGEYKQWHDQNLGFVFDFYETDSKQFWFATHNGLYTYAQGQWLENNWQEGLPDGRSYFIKSDGSSHMVAGGDMGLRIQHSGADTDPPETFIPLAENNTEFVNQGDIRFRLRAKDRWDFTQPERLLYSYKINDSEWSEFQEEPTLIFTNQLPGTYTLSARAMDRNRNIDPTPARLTYTVNPPWYLEPVFGVIFFLGTTLVLFFGYYAIRNYWYMKQSLIETQNTVSLLERTKIRLTVAKLKAESATKAKDGFLARMSHEIRTPLNGIIGNLQLLTPTKLNSDERSFLQTATVSANTLLDIIGDVLDFAKIESGKLELEEKPTSPAALFEETIAVMATRAQEKGIALSHTLSDTIPALVLVDPVRLRQVLMNIIGNAIKFTDHGSVVVHINSSEMNSQQAMIRVDVKDTGIGFDTSSKENLFREFEQDHTSNKTAEGTGLGLSICKRIIELMGGSIDCESLKGVGSRFWFEIPVQIIDNSTNVSTVLTPLAVDLPTFNLEHPILVIDDTSANRLLARNQLTKLGIQSDIESSGKEALGRVQKKQYSMILVDCSMPEMDGFEFTKRFRNFEHSSQTRIPIIAMTAHVVADIREHCFNAGMDDYLSKPVRIENLVEIIQRWIHVGDDTTDDSDSHHEDMNAIEYTLTLSDIAKVTSIDDPEDLHEFLHVVQDEQRMVFDQLQNAAENKEQRLFLEKAHSLKGLAGPVQLTQVVDLIKKCQSTVVDGSWDEVPEMLSEIDSWIDTFHSAVMAMNSVDTQNRT